MSAKVAIRYGSLNDKDKMKGAARVLDAWGVEFDEEVLSAHRDAEESVQFARTAKAKGYKTIIAGAGMANHLAGVMAANSDLLVIGVPLSGGGAGGLDAILSTLQMPPGVPVATVALDGSVNAALLAIRHLAANDPRLARMYRGYRERGCKVKGPMPNHSGKVRDSFAYKDDGILLQFVSDRLSAFDWVLDSSIPGKGAVLTALTKFWLSLPEIQAIVPNHLLDEYSIDEEDWMRPLEGRLLVVRRLNMIPLECIVRGYLEGSAWREYQRSGTMHGDPLPAGMRRCEKLPEPVFTPSTKAPEGEHDENISVEQAAALLGDPSLVARLEGISLALYRAASAIAEARGILILDTKFEFGYNLETGEITLADEVFTPDSSRFVDTYGYEPGRPPLSMDKEYARNWLLETGWDPKSEEPPPPLPLHVIYETSRRYGDIAERLTGTNPVAQ